MNPPAPHRFASSLASGCVLAAMLLGGGAVQAQAPEQSEASRFVYSASGDAVTDTKTGRTWRRCSAGQTWNGNSCIGSMALFTHDQAIAYAQTQAGWRLPTARELGSLVDRTRSKPAINVTAFPNTSSTGYWTSSTLVGYPDYAWSVYFFVGYVNASARSTNRLHVRLVR
ncbi:MAG: hypothetical protein RLZZ494_1312 [Pseudomonadota bacterium]|nr:DUF1566 domain-containing protein [Vitreoscilla filiformis]